MANIDVDGRDRARLQKWARSRTAPARIVVRSRIVLLAISGFSSSTIARRLGTTVNTVKLWRRRFEDGGVEAIVRDASGRGRKPGISADVVDSVRDDLARGQGVRATARRFKISAASVVRIRQRKK
jgi:transposase